MKNVPARALLQMNNLRKMWPFAPPILKNTHILWAFFWFKKRVKHPQDKEPVCNPAFYIEVAKINHPHTPILSFYCRVLSIPSRVESDLYIQESNIYFQTVSKIYIIRTLQEFLRQSNALMFGYAFGARHWNCIHLVHRFYIIKLQKRESESDCDSLILHE